MVRNTGDIRLVRNSVAEPAILATASADACKLPASSISRDKPLPSRPVPAHELRIIAWREQVDRELSCR